MLNVKRRNKIMEINAMIDVAFPYIFAVLACVVLYKMFKKPIDAACSYLGEAFSEGEESLEELSLPIDYS